MKSENKAVCENGIISASFNKHTSISSADSAVFRKAEKDANRARERGHGLISHPIYRSAGEEFLGKPIDRLKFLFPIAGVPIIVYSMLNAMHSGLRKVAVVGSPEERMVFDSFVEHFDPQARYGTEFVFGAEPDSTEELSRAATIRSGFRALDSPRGPVFSIAGDLPLMHTIDNAIMDADVGQHVGVFDMNAKQNLEDRMPWERNFYHRVFGYNGEEIDFKEPNLEVVDFSATGFFPYDVFYSSRKGGGFGVGSVFRMAQRSLSQGYAGRSTRLFLTLLLNPGIISSVSEFRRTRILRVGYDLLSGLSDAAFGGKTKIKFEHREPARLYDVDSFEDWQCYELLASYSMMQKDDPDAGLAMVYPHAAEIAEFREEVMPGLREKIHLLKVFSDFAGHVFQMYGLGVPCLYSDDIRFPGYCAEKGVENAFRAFSEPR